MKVYNGFAPAGCDVSEKCDGICAEWDGTQLKTREGGILDAPEWFTDGLPACELRGELWCGRGQYEMVLSVCKSHHSPERWRAVRYMVFDGPCDAELGEHAEHVTRTTVRDAAELDEIFQRVTSAGGEGVVIRDAAGTDHKHKPISDDDAVVIAHADRKIRVRDRAGREFAIMLMVAPPAVGAVVVFSFSGRTGKGTPKQPKLIGVRAETTLAF